METLLDTSPHPLPGRGGEGARGNAPTVNPVTGRLRVCDVQRIHDAVGGDPVTEEMVLRFIGDRYDARNFLHISPKVAGEILKRPVEFIRAAKKHCELELPF